MRQGRAVHLGKVYADAKRCRFLAKAQAQFIHAPTRFTAAILLAVFSGYVVFLSIYVIVA